MPCKACAVKEISSVESAPARRDRGARQRLSDSNRPAHRAFLAGFIADAFIRLNTEGLFSLSERRRVPAPLSWVTAAPVSG